MSDFDAATFAAGLVVLGVLGTGAFAWSAAAQSAWFPQPTAAGRLLTRCVLALGTVVVVGQGLGSVGGLSTVPMGIVGLGLAGVARVVARRRPAPPEPEAARRERASADRAACATALGAAGAWSGIAVLRARTGYGEFDSVFYHLPIAGGFAHTGSIGSIWTLTTESAMSVYPHTGELLLGMLRAALGTDAAVPVVNLSFLALAMLAGWCAGSARSRERVTLALTAAAFTVPVLVRLDAGSAKNDIGAMALLLASAVLGPLDETSRVGRSAFPAALAAGLAFSIRFTVVPFVALLAVAMVLLAPAARLRTLAWIVAGAGLPSVAWFGRNLARTGSPLPLVDLGPIQGWHLPVQDRLGTSLLDLAHQPVAVRAAPAILHDAWGPLWWVLVLVAVASVASLLVLRDRVRRWTGLVVVGSLVGYAATPFTLGGRHGEAVLLGANTRIALPYLGVALIALATSDRPVSRRTEALVIAGAGGWVVVAAAASGSWAVRGAAVGAAIGAAGAAWWRPGRTWRLGSSAAGRLGCVGAIGLLSIPVASAVHERQVAVLRAFPGVDSIEGSTRVVLAGDAIGYPYAVALGGAPAVQVGTVDGRGQLVLILDCSAWKAAVVAAGADVVVTADAAPFVGELPEAHEPLPYGDWLALDPAAEQVGGEVGGTVRVFRVEARSLDPAACPGP